MPVLKILVGSIANDLVILAFLAVLGMLAGLVILMTVALVFVTSAFGMLDACAHVWALLLLTIADSNAWCCCCCCVWHRWSLVSIKNGSCVY